MLIRGFGIFITILSTLYVFLAISALSDVSSSAEILVFATQDTSDSINGADWTLHWRITSIVMLVFGLILGVAGVAMFLRRKWSLIILASATSVLCLLEIIALVTGFSKYAFEASFGQVVFLLVVVMVTVICFKRWHVKELC